MSKLSFLFGRKTKTTEQKPEPRLSNQMPYQTHDHEMRQNPQRSHRFDPTPYDDDPQVQRTAPYLRSPTLEQNNPSFSQPDYGMNRRGGEEYQPQEAYPAQPPRMQSNRPTRSQPASQTYDLFEDLSFVQTQDVVDELPYNNDFEFNYTPRSRDEMYEATQHPAPQPMGQQVSGGGNRPYPPQPQFSHASYDPRMGGGQHSHPHPASPQQMYQDSRYQEPYPHDPRMHGSSAYSQQPQGLNAHYPQSIEHPQQRPYYPNHFPNDETFEQAQYHEESEPYGYASPQEMQDQRNFTQASQPQQHQSAPPAQRSPLHSVTSRFMREEETAEQEAAFQPQQRYYQDNVGKPPLDKHPQEEKFKASLKLVISITGLVLVTGVVWGAYKWFSQTTSQGPVLITAPSTPLKARPDTPGGTSFPYQDKLVYDRLLPQTHEKGEDVEKLLPDPEIQVVEPPVYEEVVPVQVPVPVQVAESTTPLPQHQPLQPQQATQNPAAIAIDAQNQELPTKIPQPVAQTQPNEIVAAPLQPSVRAEVATQSSQVLPVQVQEGNYMVLLGTLPSKEKATTEKQRLQKKFKKHLNTNVLVKSTTLSNGKTAYKLVARQSFPSKEAADSFCKKLDGTSCRSIKE